MDSLASRGMVGWAGGGQEPGLRPPNAWGRCKPTRTCAVGKARPPSWCSAFGHGGSPFQDWFLRCVAATATATRSDMVGCRGSVPFTECRHDRRLLPGAAVGLRRPASSQPSLPACPERFHPLFPRRDQAVSFGAYAEGLLSEERRKTDIHPSFHRRRAGSLSHRVRTPTVDRIEAHWHRDGPHPEDAGMSREWQFLLGNRPRASPFRSRALNRLRSSVRCRRPVSAAGRARAGSRHGQVLHRQTAQVSTETDQPLQAGGSGLQSRINRRIRGRPRHNPSTNREQPQQPGRQSAEPLLPSSAGRGAGHPGDVFPGLRATVHPCFTGASNPYPHAFHRLTHRYRVH